MKRTIDIARIQTVHWPGIFGWPLGILTLALLANIAIFGSLDGVVPSDSRATGGITSIYVVMLVSYLQTMTQVFPFALGLGVTRRAFLAGTALLVVVQALAFGLLLVVLLEIEQATDGWGVGTRFFGVGFLVQDNPLAQWAVYTVPFLALAAIGVFLGVVFKRWGQTGVYAVVVGTVVLVVGAVLLVNAREWWSAIGSFFTDQPTFALLAGYPLIVAAALAGAAFLAIRRATP